MSQTSTNIAPQVKFYDAGETFSGNKSGTTVRGFDNPSTNTPAINQNYEFHSYARDVIVWFIMEKPEPLYIYGGTGCGKSSLVRQLSARLNYPVYEVNAHDRLEFSDLVGHFTVQNGNMVFQYGALALAMKNGGLFLINEIDACPPSVLMSLHTVLEGSPLTIPENSNEIIHPADTFRFCATANTSGAGDESGLYQGTMRQNLAFMDRFIVVEATYPDKDVELRILKKSYPALPDMVAEKMVDYANEVRKAFIGEMKAQADNPLMDVSCEVTLSTRTLLRWADLCLRFEPLAKTGISPVKYALDRALGFRASKTTRAMLHELLQRVFVLEGGNNNSNQQTN